MIILTCPSFICISADTFKYTVDIFLSHLTSVTANNWIIGANVFLLSRLVVECCFDSSFQNTFIFKVFYSISILPRCPSSYFLFKVEGGMGALWSIVINLKQ